MTTYAGFLVLAVTALVLSGCTSAAAAGYGYSTGSPATAPTALMVAPATTPETKAPDAGAGSVKVVLKDFAFSPSVVTIAPGTTVVWQNDDQAIHTITADGATFDSGNVKNGGAFSFTFQSRGTYAYYCRYHGGPGGQGMAGKIVVQ